jgi:hypothetical protein
MAMSKALNIFIVLWVITMVIAAYFISQNKKLNSENITLTSNLTFITTQLEQTQRAAEERELEYRRIESESEELKDKYNEIESNPSQEEQNWLTQAIPTSIDDTIPY